MMTSKEFLQVAKTVKRNILCTAMMAEENDDKTMELLMDNIIAPLYETIRNLMGRDRALLLAEFLDCDDIDEDEDDIDCSELEIYLAMEHRDRKDTVNTYDLAAALEYINKGYVIMIEEDEEKIPVA